ncbi:uncharacterized protein LOC125381625 [Haliotis rufescens]|uniref:uncharacterized protein LOC125381625 n=1 Tax=Haliotis rufescens TaxID=6454 RepID=UPI00201EE601|nr:uncharacterized protein LOC125381625 [Haliotis rufescens]
MVGKCHLVVILVSIIDTFAISRHIHRGHLFCVEVCLQKRTCSAVVYNTIHNTCQVQHETAEEDELIFPTASVWGLSLEGASDQIGNETFKMWCVPAKNALQQAMHDIVCMANSVQDSSNKKEAEDINVQIKSPTLGSIGGVENATSSNKSISAVHTTLNKPSDGKTNRSSDSSRKSSASVRVTETLHGHQTTGGGSIGGATTQGGFRDIATRGGGSGGTATAFDGSDATASTEGRTDRTTRDDVQLQSFRKTRSYLDTTFDGSDATASTEGTTRDDVQLQSFRKTGSLLDTSIEQQKSTAPSVPRRFSTEEVPESIHETVTDQAASRDHSISVEQSTHHVKCTCKLHFDDN